MARILDPVLPLLLSLAACRATPNQAVLDLAEAFREGRKLDVEAHLDAQLTATSLVDQILAAVAFESPREAITGARVEAMRPILVQSIATAVSGFAGGGPLQLPAILGEQDNAVDRDSVLALFHGIVRTEQRDKVALVTINIGRLPSDTYHVALRLERGSGGWRVVGIDQLGPILQRWQEKSRGRALRAAARSDLRNYVTAQEAYFSDHNTYAKASTDLTFYPAEGVTLVIAHANREGHAATATTTTGLTCTIFVGPASRHALPPATTEGYPVCSDEK
jgi:hypothetical protein